TTHRAVDGKDRGDRFKPPGIMVTTGEPEGFIPAVEGLGKGRVVAAPSHLCSRHPVSQSDRRGVGLGDMNANAEGAASTHDPTTRRRLGPAQEPPTGCRFQIWRCTMIRLFHVSGLERYPCRGSTS